MSEATVQENEHGPDGAFLHPSMGGEAIMLSSSLGEDDDADADLAELSTHASMGMALCLKLNSIAMPGCNVACPFYVQGEEVRLSHASTCWHPEIGSARHWLDAVAMQQKESGNISSCASISSAPHSFRGGSIWLQYKAVSWSVQGLWSLRSYKR